MKNINSLFGQQIRELRKNRNLSQEALAHLADIHRNHLGGIERGENSPSLETLFKLSMALNTELSGILNKIEKEIE